MRSTSSAKRARTTATHAVRTTGSGLPRAGGHLHLVAVGGGVMVQLPLPDRGEVTIGRGREVDAHLDAPSISRRHAQLAISPNGELAIHDLGSANGTRVRGVQLAKHVLTPLRIGEVVELGSVLVTVQRHAPNERARRIWSHAFFEAHLEEACLRAHHAGDGGTLAVLSIRGIAQEHEATLGRVLRPVDVVGMYAPGEYEAIVADASPPVVAELVRVLAGELGKAARIAVASYPRDGRSPETLLAATRGTATASPATASLTGGSAMSDLRRLVERVAPGTISVLILGETGVGKEVLAESVHRASKRAGKPFLKLNCGALSESLLETELFGHEKGAFTGAIATKLGLLETADGGTIFLDELGEMPMAIQVKLLRVIEERAVLRVGGLKPKSIDVRFVAATNRDLEAEVARGAFRQDLYFRLNGISLVIPPLRERKGEIAGLADAFLAATWPKLERDGEPVPRLARDAVLLLESYAWPGNIRELRNAIERAALLCTGGTIEATHLPVERMRPEPVSTAREPVPQPARTAPANIKREIEALEKQRILDALDECAGNQTHAAKLLGISRATLVNRLDVYGIKRPRKPR